MLRGNHATASRLIAGCGLFILGVCKQGLGQVTHVIVENSGKTATATVCQTVRLDNAGRFTLPVTPDERDAIAASLQVSAGCRVVQPRPTATDAVFQAAFRLDLPALSDAQRAARLASLNGQRIRVVRPTGESLLGTVTLIEATQITIDTSPAAIPLTDILTITPIANAVSSAGIVIEGPARGEREITYQVPCPQWTMRYELDLHAGSFKVLASVANPTMASWSTGLVTLRQGSISFDARYPAPAARSTAALILAPGNSGQDWGAGVTMSDMLLFDPSQQPSGDFGYSAVKLSTRSDARPWLLDGVVSISASGRRIQLAKLPGPEQASAPNATTEDRLLPFLPVSGVQVRYDDPVSVVPQFVSLCRYELTYRLRRSTTFTATYRSGETRHIRVSLPAIAGMTVRQKSLELSTATTSQSSLAVSTYDSTVDARMAKPSDLRGLARRLAGRQEAQELKGIADAIEEQSSTESPSDR